MHMAPETFYVILVLVSFGFGFYAGRRTLEVQLAASATCLGGVVLDGLVFKTQLSEPAEKVEETQEEAWT